MIKLKRIYEAPSEADGLRILVERLWPRGLTKEKAAIQELDRNPEGVAKLREFIAQGPVTFVFAARDEQHNSAVVLKEYLEIG